LGQLVSQEPPDLLSSRSLGEAASGGLTKGAQRVRDVGLDPHLENVTGVHFWGHAAQVDDLLVPGGVDPNGVERLEFVSDADDQGCFGTSPTDPPLLITKGHPYKIPTTVQFHVEAKFLVWKVCPILILFRADPGASEIIDSHAVDG
jgi:hypothetical protein